MRRPILICILVVCFAFMSAWLAACDRGADSSHNNDHAAGQSPSPEHAHDDHVHAEHEGHEHDEHEHADHDHHDHDHAEHDHDGHNHGEEGHEEHAREVRLTPDALARYGVKVEAAGVTELRPTLVAPARIAFNAEAMAHVGSPLSGRVVEIKVRLGDRVTKGAELIMIESPDLGLAQAEYFEKRVAAETAGPAAELAKESWERAKEVFDQTRGISLTEVQKREAEYKAALAAQRAAEAGVIGAENRLRLLGMSSEAIAALAASGRIDSRFPIAAPADGQIVSRDVTLGELVGPADDPLLTLADTSTLWVLADVPEARLAEVAEGARAWIRAGELDPHRHEGQVSHIAPMVDAQTRSAAVRIVVTCEDRTLKPGMFVQVEIESTDPARRDPSPVVAVPEGAIQMIDGRPVVFVPAPDEDHTFIAREVTIGKPVGGLVPVHSGLAQADRLVTAGSFILKAELGKGTAEHVH